MKIELIKRGNRIDGARPMELTDVEKITKAIQVMLNLGKQERIGKEHLALIPESVIVKMHDKRPLGMGRKNSYGYPSYSHNTEVRFKMHREYNPQKDGTWGSHKFVLADAKITFEDDEDSQIGSYQEIKIIRHTMQEVE